MMRWSVPTSRDVLVFFCYRLGLFVSDQTVCLPASPLMRGHLQCFASPECHNVSVLRIHNTCTLRNCIKVEKYQMDPAYRVFIKPLHQVPFCCCFCVTSIKSGVVMKPFPSLSKTRKASLISSSISASLNSLLNHH